MQGIATIANRWNFTNVQPKLTTKALLSSASMTQNPNNIHIACGYVAGLHFHDEENKNNSDFDSFDDAWDTIQQVPTELMIEFENDLWTNQKKKFIHGNKVVSVLDSIEEKKEKDSNDDEKDNVVYRYLVLNERPNLIQTAIEVPHVGAPYKHNTIINSTPRRPSPISQTHLGGLAMVLPFWYRIAEAETVPSLSPPNCVLIGAGGCSLAHTLADNLYIKHGPQQYPNNLNVLTAVEPCAEIIEASRLWFGGGEFVTLNSQRNENNIHDHLVLFDLVHDTGESYLKLLLSSQPASTCEKKDEKYAASSGDTKPLIDVLIIDAEDGTGAPPTSMRKKQFWSDLLIPSLNTNLFCTGNNAIIQRSNRNEDNENHENINNNDSSRKNAFVIGVNFIGTKQELNDFIDMLHKVFTAAAAVKDGSYEEQQPPCAILVVDPPEEANVSDRHKLIFILPNSITTNITVDDLIGYVDQPSAWEKKIQIALRSYCI